MHQASLFERDYDPRKLAARADPESSHKAAAELVESGRLGSQCKTVLEALKKEVEPATACEIAKNSGLDRIMVSRRLPDLEKVGLVKRCGQRECKASQPRKSVQETWSAT